MSLSERLEHHLQATGLPYDTVSHRYAATARECAEKAHIPQDHMAKTVLVHREDGPMLAVVPANHQLDLSRLQQMTHRRLGLAPESELEEIFDDCSPGAAPPVGDAYDIPTIVDNSLMGLSKVWFEAGDHRTLVEMEGGDFDRLMRRAQHGSICIH